MAGGMFKGQPSTSDGTDPYLLVYHCLNNTGSYAIGISSQASGLFLSRILPHTHPLSLAFALTHRSRAPLTRTTRHPTPRLLHQIAFASFYSHFYSHHTTPTAATHPMGPWSQPQDRAPVLSVNTSQEAWDQDSVASFNMMPNPEGANAPADEQWLGWYEGGTGPGSGGTWMRRGEKRE